MNDALKLLLINPNTSAQVTNSVAALVLETTGPGVEVHAVTAQFGFEYISSKVASVIAAHAVLDAAAQALCRGVRPDAILIACFGDPGLQALEELTGLPVVGFAESGIRAAGMQPGKFVLATRGTVWRDMLQDLVRTLGVADRVAKVLTIDDAGNSAQEIAAFLSESAHSCGADRVVLGGAGLIPILPLVIEHATVEILDPHREAIHQAVKAAARGRTEHWA